MSNPSDEKPQRTAGTEEEQLSGKIEKVTESLLSQWEISEDDFEDTQDLTETAAHISRQIAPGASNRNAAGSIRREEAEPRSQATPHSQTAVSYTHLDVYKRQAVSCILISDAGCFQGSGYEGVRLVRDNV